MPAHVDAYCDISGMSDLRADPDKPCFYAHDGATCTLLRVVGAHSILSDDEAGEAMMNAFQQIATNLREKGHGMTITFEQSANTDEDVERLMSPLSDASHRKGLSMAATLGETEALLREQLIQERILIALWTYRDIADRARYQDDQKTRKGVFGALGLLGQVQDTHGPYASLAAAHWGYVSSVETALAAHGFMVSRLGGHDGVRRDLAEVRRALLFHETPNEWRPMGPGDTRYPKVSGRKSGDVSVLFAPTLDRQIMTSAVKASSDLLSISLGGRKFAFSYLSGFPRYMPPFRGLVDNIRGSGTRQRKIPFRISFFIEGGARVNPLRQILLTLGSIFSAHNKNIRLGLDGVNEALGRDNETFVQARIMATTWIEPGETDAILAERRSRLVRALNSWQSPTVTDSCGDPLRLLVETAPGMVAVARTGNPFLAPVRELSQSLPFHSDAPLEDNGETVFVTMDDKPMPFKAHSPLQDSWLSLIWAPPGSGKSVLMNAMNCDFAAYYPSASLPYIGCLDIGPSSLGFINLLKASLRPDQKNLVQYVKLKNEQENRTHKVNPFDIGLGRRAPMTHEQTFVQNVLATMIGKNDDSMMTALIEQVVTNVYARCSDLSVNSSPKPWQPAKDDKIDQRAAELGIALHEDLSYWALVDAFASKGDFVMAERAQRFAVPVLSDVLRYFSDQEIQRRFSPELCRFAAVQIESAQNNYPVFSGETQLDIGEARIVSIDLNDVIIRSPNTDADHRANVLFFLMARQMFVKKISGEERDIEGMRLPPDERTKRVYVNYWRGRFTEIQQTRKRFCFDEFHITGSSPVMERQITVDIREGRKWGLEIYLASQKIEDFANYVNLASNIFVLKSDTEQDRREMQRVLGVSDAVVAAVKRHVKGPPRDLEIAPVMLIGRSTKREKSWLLAKNRVGPVKLWALSTTLEDRAVRDVLYTKTGDVNTALEMLAARFPNGSCGDYWSHIASRSDPTANIAEIIADRLLAERVGIAAE